MGKATNKKTEWYVFRNHKASCGEPNKITGRMSIYGEIVKFRNKRERDDYFKDYRYSTHPAKKCSKRQLRGFHEGMTVRDFEEHLSEVEFTEKDEDGDWI